MTMSNFKIIDALKDGGQIVYNKIYHIYTLKTATESIKLSHIMAQMVMRQAELVKVEVNAVHEFYRIAA